MKYGASAVLAAAHHLQPASKVLTAYGGAVRYQLPLFVSRRQSRQAAHPPNEPFPYAPFEQSMVGFPQGWFRQTLPRCQRLPFGLSSLEVPTDNASHSITNHSRTIDLYGLPSILLDGQEGRQRATAASSTTIRPTMKMRHVQ